MTVACPWPLPDKATTRRLARCLASLTKPGDFFVLSGPLAAGKTFFARAFAKQLPRTEPFRVTSPTFSIIHEYPTVPILCHVDLYRLASEKEVFELDLEAERQRGKVLLVEWGEPYRGLLGGDALTLSLTLNPRTVSWRAEGPRSDQILSELVSVLE